MQVSDTSAGELVFESAGYSLAQGGSGLLLLGLPAISRSASPQEISMPSRAPRAQPQSNTIQGRPRRGRLLKPALHRTLIRPHPSAVVEKEGFYWSAMPGFDFQSVVGNHWQPWNRTFVVPLKKVGRRIPMYVSNVEAKLPIIGEPVGFDLIAGDWVAPYGSGKVGDFIFASSLKWRAQDDYDVEVNLRFSNEGDGVHLVLASHDAGGSVLVLPHQAPETEYQSFLPYKFSLRPGGTWDDKREDRNFFYRARTAKEHEQVKKALYGKIHRNFRYYVGGKDNITVAFIYYLNPDGTRNLEFDGNNLFPHLQERNDLKAP